MNKTKFSLEKAVKAVEISSRIEGHVIAKASLSIQKRVSNETIQPTKEIKNSSNERTGHRSNNSSSNRK